MKHDDGDLYAQAATELDDGTADPGLMAKAMAMAEGDAKRERALYVRYRAEQLGAAASVERRERLLASRAVRVVMAIAISFLLMMPWAVASQVFCEATRTGRCMQLVLFVWVLLWPWAFLLRQRPHWLLSWRVFGIWVSCAAVLDMFVAMAIHQDGNGLGMAVLGLIASGTLLVMLLRKPAAAGEYR